MARRRTLFGAAGQCSLEGMAVSVAKTGDDAAGRDRRVVGLRPPRNIVDKAVRYLQQDIVRPAVRQQRFSKLYIQASPCYVALQLRRE
jgi:hypothetical protein